MMIDLWELEIAGLAPALVRLLDSVGAPRGWEASSDMIEIAWVGELNVRHEVRPAAVLAKVVWTGWRRAFMILLPQMQHAAGP
jgi:hypothetical protein